MDIDKVRRLSTQNRFLYWIRERYSILLKKQKGLNKPWTDDEILQSYRFCNIRRMDDKVSCWLLDNWYIPFKDHPNMLAAAAIARFINKPESLKPVTHYVFNSHGEVWWSKVKGELRAMKEEGKTVFNGAYMVRGNSIQSEDKIGTVVDEYVRPMIDSEINLDKDSMETSHTAIQDHYGFGSFMSGQIVADLRWAMSGGWKDKLTWAPCGPGSARGLARLIADRYETDWLSLSKTFVSRSEVFLKEFRDHILDRIVSSLPEKIRTIMEAHDYQNCLCEFDKYERTLIDNRRPKQLYQGV